MPMPMRPSDDICYRAMRSRDARFDGWFYVGVTSTGIYCRPSCPAMSPRRENTTFHASAASAQAAGFRACKRCRPDAVPGSPAWNMRADVAGRALRLIDDGMVDRIGVAGLARRLGYSARQLHRTLVAEVGAGPLALARAQRAQTARVLLETTAMPAGDVAFAAGFGSIRQFNDTLREVFAATPTQLRAGRRGGRERDADAGSADAGGGAPSGWAATSLRLAYRQPMSLDALLGFLRARAIPGVERAEGDGGYSAALRAPHGPVLVRIDPAPSRAAGDRARDRNAPAVSCRMTLRDVRDLAFAVGRVRALLDLDADPVEADRVLGADPLLADDVRGAPGLRSPGALDGFELAVRAIVGQQVSVTGARTVLGRIAAALGEPIALCPSGSPCPSGAAGAASAPSPAGWLLFPSPEALAAADADAFPLPAARVRTIRAVAAAVAAGDLALDRGADRARTRAQLLALPGIGPWTADYIAMRALGDPDVLLGSDLIVRRALAARGDAVPATWAPWRSYATHRLWHARGASPVAASPVAASPAPAPSTEPIRDGDC